MDAKTKIVVLVGMLLVLPGAFCECVTKLDTMQADPLIYEPNGSVFAQTVLYRHTVGSRYESKTAELIRHNDGGFWETLATIDFTDWELPWEPASGNCKEECEIAFEFAQAPVVSGDNIFVYVETVMDPNTFPYHSYLDDLRFECPNMIIP